MSWASRRQFKYLSVFLLIVGLIIFAFIYPLIFKEPTCADKKQNGNETGIDCGGSCLKVCQTQALSPTILWSRAFPVTDSFYNLVALVENPNKSAGLRSVNYEFRIYDTNNKLIGRRQGSTYLAPNKQMAIFESRFDSGETEIRSIVFEFVPPYDWIQTKLGLDLLPISADRITWGEDEMNPTLTARVKNESIYDIPSFEAIAIVYDLEKNAINASKTYKENLRSNGTSSVIFTWPNKLNRISVSEEVLLQINPFTTVY